MLKNKDGSFFKVLLTLAIPISMQNLITYAVGFADNLMIGTLGDNAVSGVYMGNQVQTVLQMFTMGIEGAILILGAQYWGKKDVVSIRKIIGVAYKFSFVCGLLFMLAATVFPYQVISLLTDDVNVIEEGAVYLGIVGFSYLFFASSQMLIASLRSVETAKLGFYVSVMALFVNVGLNYLLIFGVGDIIPAMGVKGAAIATLISRIAEFGFVLYYVKFRDKKLMLKFKDIIGLDKVMFGDFVKYGLPVFGGQVVWGCNMVANTVILGRFTSEVIAATAVTGMLHNLVYVWMAGLSSGVGIITGKTVGEGKIEKIKSYSKKVQILFLGVGVISGAIVFALKEPFIGLYDISPEAMDYSRQFINVISISIIGTCYQAACLFGLVKSGGDISFVFKNDTIFVFLVVIPSAVIASLLGAEPWIVFACLKCDQILKCFVAFVKINKYNWIKNLTRDT